MIYLLWYVHSALSIGVLLTNKVGLLLLSFRLFGSPIAAMSTPIGLPELSFLEAV